MEGGGRANGPASLMWPPAKYKINSCCLFTGCFPLSSSKLFLIRNIHKPRTSPAREEKLAIFSLSDGWMPSRGNRVEWKSVRWTYLQGRRIICNRMGSVDNLRQEGCETSFPESEICGWSFCSMDLKTLPCNFLVEEIVQSRRIVDMAWLVSKHTCYCGHSLCAEWRW